MYTYDYLATHYSADSEVLVNLVDGLVEYDVYGILRPSLAESWTISEDGTQYTFHLREANWVETLKVQFMHQ
jgi:oligopeptide transport system substrate-binding protein